MAIFVRLISAKMICKVSAIIQKIEADGWMLLRIKGSHRQYKYPTKKGKVTINGKLSDDLGHDLV